MSMHSIQRLAALLGVVLVACCIAPQSFARETATTDTYEAMVEDGKRLSAAGNHRAAIEAYGKANELAGGESAHCLLSLSILHNATQSHDQAMIAAQHVLGLTEDAGVRRRAYRELGVAMVMSSRTGQTVPKEKQARERLRRAEQAFRKALELDPGDGEIYYLLADALLAEMVTWEEWSLHEEIKDLAYRYLEHQPEGHAADWAREVSCQEYETSDKTRVIPRGENRPPYYPETPGEIDFESIVRPVKLSTPGPRYPQWARMHKIQGKVIVQVIIDREGNVREPEVLEGLPLCLSEEAVAAVQRWTFEPATLDGEPVDVYYNLTVNFRLK